MKIFNRGGQFSSEDGGVQEANKLGHTTRNYPLTKGSAQVIAKTADYTLNQQTDMDAILTNTGASGAIVFTLPTAKANHGVCFRVHAFAAQQISLSPQTGEAISLSGSAVVSKNLVIAGVIGNYVDIYCNGISWEAVNCNGVVTKAP